ncbi:hypothetical protein [Helicobacter sp. 23-1045]
MEIIAYRVKFAESAGFLGEILRFYCISQNLFSISQNLCVNFSDFTESLRKFSTSQNLARHALL